MHFSEFRVLETKLITAIGSQKVKENEESQAQKIQNSASKFTSE